MSLLTILISIILSEHGLSRIHQKSFIRLAGSIKQQSEQMNDSEVLSHDMRRRISMRTSQNHLLFMFFIIVNLQKELCEMSHCVRNMYFSRSMFFQMVSISIQIFEQQKSLLIFGIQPNFLFLYKNICILSNNPYSITSSSWSPDPCKYCL